MKLRNEEREQINIAFKMLLIQKGYSLLSWCEKFGYNYSKTYDRLNKLFVIEEEVNEMISTIDDSKKLVKIENKWEIQ